MNKKEKFVITINRELGSGGRTVGRKLAEKLNVGFYDKTLIRELTEKFNLSVEEVEKMKEQLYQIIARAENWLNTHNFRNPIIKWETSKWGEVPADFGRK